MTATAELLGGEDASGDPVEALVGFTAVLRAASLSITSDRVAAFLIALDALDVTSMPPTYWAGRLTPCADPDDLPRYDQAFERWFTPRRGGGTRVVDERRPPPWSWCSPTAGNAMTRPCSASRWRGCACSRTGSSGSTRMRAGRATRRCRAE